MSGCADPGGSVGAFLCQAGQVLRAAGVESPRHEARLLLAHAMGCREEDLLRDARAAVPASAALAFGTLLRRRAGREPMAYLLGATGFWTLTLEVSPATLIPRADSEAVVEAALAAFEAPQRVRRVLDLGTGTGALLLAVLSECPSASGVGVDVSAEAAALAARNAAANGMADRAAFFCGDWAEAITGRFDLVLSNPPYVESREVSRLMPDVAQHEPARALDGGDDGFDAYRRILRSLRRLLAPGGRAVFEIGKGQRPGLEALASSTGLRPAGVRHDLGGIERAVVLDAA